MPSRRAAIHMTPEEIDAYLAGRHTLKVATINHDGAIHLVAMWYGFLDGAVAFWTYAKSQKVRNLERDPRLTGLVDTGERYEELRGVELVGRGEIITDREQVMAVGQSIYDRYQADGGGPPVDLERMGAKRCAVRLTVDRVVSWDHTKLGGGY